MKMRDRILEDVAIRTVARRERDLNECKECAIRPKYISFE